jgi:hypothetical protein
VEFIKGTLANAFEYYTMLDQLRILPEIAAARGTIEPLAANRVVKLAAFFASSSADIGIAAEFNHALFA